MRKFTRTATIVYRGSDSRRTPSQRTPSASSLRPQSDHSRAYADDDEETMRFGLFKDSLKNIDFLNT